MSTTKLQERLHRLADPLSTPANEPTLAAVHDRTRRLRRRRQLGQGVAAGVVGLVVVAGGLAVRGAQDAPTAEVGPVADAANSNGLPDVGLDLAGFDEVAEPLDLPLTPTTYDGGSYQVFRRPGDLLGPTIWLRHEFATDTVVAQTGQDPVVVAGNDGALGKDGAVLQLLWNPDPGQDRSASLFAVGLSEQELVDFAAGLTPRDPAVLELDATYLPAGVEEEALSPRVAGERTERQRTYDDGTAQVQFTIVEEEEHVYELRLEQALQGCAWEADSCHADADNEIVEVLGRPAVLAAEGESDGRWQIYWRQSPDVSVELTILSADRPTVDRILTNVVMWVE